MRKGNKLGLVFVAVLALAILAGLQIPTVFGAPLAQHIRVSTFCYRSDNDRLTLGAGFTIPASRSFWAITASTTRTSDTSMAIKNGRYLWQELLLYNAGSNTIVIKNSANTDFGAADVTLGGTDMLRCIWNGSDWIRQFVADN